MSTQATAHVMIFREEEQRWVPSQRRAPQGLKALAAVADVQLVDAARLAELEERPIWNGTLKPNRPRLRPIAASERDGASCSIRSTPLTTREHPSTSVVTSSLSLALGAQTARTVTAQQLPPLDRLPPHAPSQSPSTKRLASRSSIPGHFHPTLASTAADRGDESDSVRAMLTNFERRVPLAGDTEDEDEEDGHHHDQHDSSPRHHNHHLPRGGAMNSTHRLRNAAGALAAAHAIQVPLAGGMPALPNPLPSMLVGVPLPEIYAAYCRLETPVTRRHGMTIAFFGDMIRDLLGESFCPSDALITRAFECYDAAVKSPEPHVAFFTFFVAYAAECCSAATMNEISYFFDAASGFALTRAQNAASAVVSMQSLLLSPTLREGALPPINSKRADKARKSIVAFASPNRTAAVVSANDGAISTPVATALPVGSSFYGAGSAGGASAAVYVSASMLHGPMLRQFINEHVKTGGARAAWGTLADELDRQMPHVLSLLRRFTGNTHAFEVATARTTIERRLLGDAPAPAYPRLTLPQVQCIVLSSTALTAAMTQLWYPH
jgi:hypothetical protein